MTPTTIELGLQIASGCESVPAKRQFRAWCEAALADHGPGVLAIRIVDREESAALNLRYRHKHGPTNVLSFAAEVPAVVNLPLLGDLVICAPLVADEAAGQGKEVLAHWAHLVVHGVLHLLGFDHQTAEQARSMEQREIEILAGLGYASPYES